MNKHQIYLTPVFSLIVNSFVFSQWCRYEPTNNELQGKKHESEKVAVLETFRFGKGKFQLCMTMLYKNRIHSNLGDSDRS